MSPPARTIHLADPPRPVPLRAQVAALFGGAAAQIGWAIFVAGLLAVVVVVLQSEAMTWLAFRGPTETTEGTVTGVEETESLEGDGPAYRVRYRYRLDGIDRTGSSISDDGALKSGDPVTVEYPRGDHGRSRIRGLRVHRIGSGAAVIVIFPLVGLVAVLAGLPAAFRRRRLLKAGKLGYGRLVGKVDTGNVINNQAVYELTFEMVVPKADRSTSYRQADPGEAEVIRVTHDTHLLAALEDDGEEPFLYDPRDPGRAYPVDGLPAKVTIDADGHIQAPKAALFYLLLPVAALVMLGLLCLPIR